MGLETLIAPFQETESHQVEKPKADKNQSGCRKVLTRDLMEIEKLDDELRTRDPKESRQKPSPTLRGCG